MNRVNEQGLLIAAFCGRGKVRAQNEDNISIDAETLEHEVIQSREIDRHNGHLILVADGMGGHAKGELASQLTIDAIGKNWLKRENFEVIEVIREANRTVYDAMGNDPELRGMGATVVGALVHGSQISWFNLGDSRGYLFRENLLAQFSIDHVPRGVTTPGKRRSHSITQSIGGGFVLTDVWPASGCFDVRKGDILLFCTDGLTDAVPDDHIRRCIHDASSLFGAAASLREAAEERGAPDNVSFVLVKL